MTPSPSPRSLTAVGRGTYSSDGFSIPTGIHSDAGYTAGDCNIGPPLCGTELIEYRNWFQFDLSSVTSVVTAATLQVQGLLLTDCAPQPCSPAPTATYTLFDVSTASTTALGTNSMAIWADLGSGTPYGSLTASATSPSAAFAGNGPPVSIPLNAAAVAAINANRGASFVLGGAVTTLMGGSERVELFVSGGVKPSPMTTILQLQ